MLTKKHQQNQMVVTDEVVSKATINSQQKVTQPDATNPQEHGRSMTEMLGVLAIIGILSIGGIQGYRYAMNKYHSNEVVNELNLLNAQLAVFMSGVHGDEAVMSLGEPYDNGEKVKTGGYVFSYGCGQDPDSMTPCDLDETGYYMTLNGLPKDVCQSASQMTTHMMNLVEQRVNGEIDDEGVLCQDGDNQLTFLFDANDGQGVDNTNDETAPYETTLYCELYCDWTGWLDSGKPDYTKTGGDVESLENVCKNRYNLYRADGWAEDIKCRAAMFPNTPLDQLEQYGLICNTEVGFVCRNKDQKPGGATPPACLNYQINVYCCYCK